MTKNRIFRIVAFFIFATITCNLFRFETFGFGKILNEYPLWIKIASLPLQALGLLVAGHIAITWLRKVRATTHSFLGNSHKYPILMAVVPILLLTVFGIENTHDINTHFLGLVIGVLLLIYCIFEEYGWRGYLEEELSAEKEWTRILIIGILWYCWHLPWVENNDLMSHLQFFGIMLLGSWGIGKVMQSTKSVLASACFHMLYSILILQIKSEVTLQTNTKFIIIAICIAVWIVVLKMWEKEKV